MIIIDGVEYRNLQEQVLKNKEDIEYLKNYDTKISGQVAEESQLPESAEIGTAYEVGVSAPYDLYVYLTQGWVNLGKFPSPGPKGDTGPTGPIGLRGQRGSIWSSVSRPTSPLKGDQYLDNTGMVYEYNGEAWTPTRSIVGPRGVIGPVGPTGVQGPQGPRGPQGIQGPAGAAFSIIGLIASTEQLPDPSTVPDNYAYMVGTTAPYDLYVQVVPEGEPQQWLDAGKVEGVVGPQGPVGPQGGVGPTGAQGPAATIQVGTVTTLEPGEQATVTNSGTSGAAVFDFGIPKGESGELSGYVPHIIMMAIEGNASNGKVFSIVHAPLSTQVTHDNYKSLVSSDIPAFGRAKHGNMDAPVVALNWYTPAPNVVQLNVGVITPNSGLQFSVKNWGTTTVTDLTYNANN